MGSDSCGGIHIWNRPRRTMSNPASLRAVQRVQIPSRLADLVLLPTSILKAEFSRVEFRKPTANDPQQIIVFSPAQMLQLRPSEYSPREPIRKFAEQLVRDGTTEFRQSPIPTPLRDALGVTPSSGRKRYFDHSELHHRVIAVLNKVSSDPLKYAEVRNELHRLPLPASDDQFTKVVGVFFTKAVQEQKFGEQYAQLVHELVNSPGRSTGSEDQSFAFRLKKALVDRCQDEYTKSRELLVAADQNDSEEVAACKLRLRGTLSFVAHLYLLLMLPARTIAGILWELTSQPPSDGDIDGVLTMLKVCVGRLAKEEPAALHDVMHACRAFGDDTTIPMVPRARFLCLDAAELLAQHVPASLPVDDSDSIVHDQQPARDSFVDSNALSAPVVIWSPPREIDDSMAVKARHIMYDLAQTDDYETALRHILQQPDPCGLMIAWIHRALTTARADRERTQLPRVMRFLVERNVFEIAEARDLFCAWLQIAVVTREWDTTSKLWKHWAQVLVEDKRKEPIASQDLHNKALMQIIHSPQLAPADIDLYLDSVLKCNCDKGWDVDMSAARSAPRFRYLAHLVAASVHHRIAELPLSTVRKVGLPLDDVEAFLFCALCEKRPAWEYIRSHPHVMSLVMVQKVMGAVLAAAISQQDDSIATGAMDLLQLVVDGPDRRLREALVITELMASGALMHHHMRSPAFGYQLSKSMKDCDVISEMTLQEARQIYGENPFALDLIGPSVGRPFVSRLAMTDVGSETTARRLQLH